MKKCISLCALLFLLHAPLFAQTVRVIQSQSLSLPLPGYYPQFSPDDDKVYFTSSNYQGLYEYDLSRGVVRTLSEDPGAGYHFQISADGSSIVFRSDNFDLPKRRSAIISMNLEKQSSQVIEALAREVSPPALTHEGTLWYTVSSRLTGLTMASSSLRRMSSSQDPVLFIEDQKMALYAKHGKKILDPIPGGSYFWQSVSPDKQKILFTEARSGTHIADLEGNILLSLGKAHAPQWSPDGQWICYMDDHDNGLYFTASDIYIVSVDGKTRLPLTAAENRIEMYPGFSRKSAEKIVYHTDSGSIHILEFRIER